MQEKKILIIIFLYFIAFAVTMALIVPPFEAPDENLHLDYINYLSNYGRLPNQYEDYGKPGIFVGQGHQPPLYYILLSSLNYVVNAGGEVRLNIINNRKHELFGGTEGKVPHYNYYTGNAFNDSRTKNMFYLFRLISVLLGLITLVFIFKIASLVFSDGRCVLLSVFFAASLPQFAFINAVINNDSLAIMLMTISVYYLYRIILNPTVIRNYIVAGVFIGFSVLTKKTLLFTVPGAVLLALYFIFRSKTLTSVIIRNISALLLIASVISALYFIRNQVLYGDLLGSGMELETMPQLVSEKNLLSSFFYRQIFPRNLSFLYR